VLTKPVGSGILTKALKEKLLDENYLEELINSMALLNRVAADMMSGFDVHACTDISGFGLVGHLKEMVGEDPVEVAVEVSKVPVMPGVWEILSEGLIPGGCTDNIDYTGRELTFEREVSDLEKLVVSDPQTSGGLLIGVPENHAIGLMKRLRSAGIRDAGVIGRVKSGSGSILITR